MLAGLTRVEKGFGYTIKYKPKISKTTGKTIKFHLIICNLLNIDIQTSHPVSENKLIQVIG